MKYHVERMVPSEALLKLGIYLQTCAHIELAAWQIILEADGHPIDRGNIPVRYIDTKLVTRDLLKKLRKAASLIPLQLAARVHLLANDIVIGLPNRNAAAHGAFFEDSVTGNMQLAHFYVQGKRHQKQYFSIEDPVPDDSVREALKEADRILGEAIEVRDSIAATRKKIVKPPPPSQPPPNSSALL